MEESNLSIRRRAQEEWEISFCHVTSTLLSFGGVSMKATTVSLLINTYANFGGK